ncbi:MAG: hypothetical protein EOP83_18290 [Verrucomicrobiaceae bacterium]|nr:MAG: hypothetical protein EOP83_18290 [Verrucomicrobiaceae bacterium]
MNLLDLHRVDPIAFGFRLVVSSEIHASPDSAAVAFGIKVLGEAWREVSRTVAESILLELLRKDMAFSSPRLEEPVVRAGVDEFLASFSAESRFFTNGNWEMGWIRSKHSSTSFGPEWSPTTDATFDGGVIAIDTWRSGILWLEDED